MDGGNRACGATGNWRATARRPPAAWVLLIPARLPQSILLPYNRIYSVMKCVLVQSNGERKRWRQPCLQACRRVGGTNGSPARLPQSVLQILRPQTLHGFDTWNSKDPPTGFPAGLPGLPKPLKTKLFIWKPKDLIPDSESA